MDREVHLVGLHPELDIQHLRRHIGVVMQNPIIFPGTILDNITYGSPDLPTTEAVRAAALATADEFIRTLPDGYETYVGEGGTLLSGGQRQRIAVARALLGRPRLLVLDEPTTHLDRDARGRLMANLGAIDPKPATLLVTHDPVLAGQAHRVYHLQEGRIVDDRSLSEAVAQEGTRTKT